MKIYKILMIICIFIAGALFGIMFVPYLESSPEKPFLNSFRLMTFNNSAPHDFIKENQIEIYSDKIIINIQNASLSRYAATGSMKPVLDEYSNGIRIKPKSENDIHVGDIVSFEMNGDLIVHRIIEKGSDEKGIYFITKGDNNSLNDGKIRFNEIKYITIGVFW